MQSRKGATMKTVTETARIFGVSRQTIISWINKGRIKAIRPLKEYRIPESEIDRLMGKTNEDEKGEE